MDSVKQFKSKNRDKIYRDAPNPDLKKGSDRDFRATAQPIKLIMREVLESRHRE